MKPISESSGIQKLADIRTDLAKTITGTYESKAKPCSACMTPGICCQDAHFVNVQLTRLEAAAINQRLAELGLEVRREALARASRAVEEYGLSEAGSANSPTYACPLFERGTGCLVHNGAKPLPCITHACYDDPSDLPPDDLLAASEAKVIRLDRQVYGRYTAAMPLPLAILRNKPTDS